MKKNLFPLSSFLFPLGRRGQSLMEVLVGVAIGSLIIIAAVTVIASVLKGSADVNRVQAGAALGKELAEQVRVLSESDWHILSALSTSSANRYFLANAFSPFVAVTGTEGIAMPHVPAGLVGYWKFDENAGTTAYDFSGNNSTGTVSGNVSATSSCTIGGCFSFGGTNGSVDIPYNANLPTSGDLTFAAWVKTTNSDAGGLVSQGDGNDHTSAYQIRYGGAANTYFALGSGASATYVYLDPPVNTWSHVLVTVQGTSIQAYVNGVQAGSATFSGTRQSPNTPLHLGRRSDGYYFAGLIDDARVYNRALTSDEVTTLYRTFAYTRYFYVDDVSRDAQGAIIASGGSNDPSTKKISVVYQWPRSSTNTILFYVTRSKSAIFRQTDWAGGAGQDGPATTTNSFYASSSNVNVTTSTGSLFINL